MNFYCTCLFNDPEKNRTKKAKEKKAPKNVRGLKLHQFTILCSGNKEKEENFLTSKKFFSPPSPDKSKFQQSKS